MPFSDLTDKEIKKRVPPGLNQRWWKQAWPGEKPSKHDRSVAVAIKDYKDARRGTAQSLVVIELNKLTALLGKVEVEAKSSLKAYPKRRKAIVSDVVALNTIIEKQHKDALKFGNKTREVFRYDFAARVVDVVKDNPDCKGFKPKAQLTKIELLEAIVQELDGKNLLNSLYAEYDNALQTMVAKAVSDIKATGVKRRGRNAHNTGKLFSKIIDGHGATLADLMHKAPTNVIKKLGLNAEMEAEYQKELKKRRKEIFKGTVMTVASGVAIALPGTQAFAIYGFARSAAGLAQQIVEHNISIATAAKIIEKQLIFLATTFKKSAGRAVSETGATTLNAVLGVDIIPTLDKATSNMKLLKINTRHAGFKTQKLTDLIMDMMDSNKRLEKTVNGLPDNHPYKKRLGKNLARNERQLDKLLKKTSELAKKLNTVERKLPTLGKALNDLGKNGKGQIAANAIAKILVNLGGIASGGLVDATAAVETAAATVSVAEKVAAISIASVGYIDELKTDVEDIVALAKD